MEPLAARRLQSSESAPPFHPQSILFSELLENLPFGRVASGLPTTEPLLHGPCSPQLCLGPHSPRVQVTCVSPGPDGSSVCPLTTLLLGL